MSRPAYLSMTRWEYNDPGRSLTEPEGAVQVEVPSPAIVLPHFTEEEVQVRIRAALAQAQATWQTRTEEQLTQLTSALAQQIQSFHAERMRYFQAAEAEVVHLVLGIARRILQREAALDPTLLRGLVRVALDRLGADAPAQLRVPAALLPFWQKAQANGEVPVRLGLSEDASLNGTDCVLESGFTRAHIGLELQLKELEQSFEDLMAKRPGSNGE